MKHERHPFCSLAVRFCAAGLLLSAFCLLAQTNPPAPASQNTSEDILKLNPFEVKAGAGDVGYGTSTQQGGTRINMPINDSPMSIATINKALLEDMGFKRLSESLHVVSGMSFSGALADGRYTYRGRSSSGSNYRDGIPENFAGSGLEVVDSILFDRIEVVKGPAGVLFGSMDIGGTVNRISKRPLPNDRTVVSLGASTFNSVRAEIDMSRKLIQRGNETVAYRIPVAFQHGKSHEKGNDNVFAISPSIDYSNNRGDRVWLYSIYQNSSRVQAETVPADKGGALFYGLDATSPMWPTDQSNGNRRIYELGYTRDNIQVFGVDSSFRFVARFINTHIINEASATLTDYSLYDAQGTFLGTNAQIYWNQVKVARMDYGGLTSGVSNQEFKGGVVNFDFATAFNFLGGDHKAFIYGELIENRSRVFGVSPNYPKPIGQNSIYIAGVQRWPLNILPANWGPNLQHALISAGQFIKTNDNNGQAANTAIAGQDNISYLSNRLILVGGVRVDQNEGNTKDFIANSQAHTSASARSWKYGVVGKPLPGERGVSLYFNHATSFQPQYTIDNNPASPSYGRRFPNVIGTVDEGGVKLDMLGHRLIGSIVRYNSTLSNQLITVFPPGNTQTGGILQPVGTVFSKGWEFDLTAQPVKSVNMVVSYSDNDSRTATNLRSRGSPAKTFACLAKYSFPDPLKGFSIVGMYQSAKTRAGDGGNSFYTPDFKMTNLNLIYARSNWRLQLNIDNVLDDKNQVTGSITVGRLSLYPQRNADLKLTFYY